MRQNLTLRYNIFTDSGPAGSGFSAWKLDITQNERWKERYEDVEASSGGIEGRGMKRTYSILFIKNGVVTIISL